MSENCFIIGPVAVHLQKNELLKKNYFTNFAKLVEFLSATLSFLHNKTGRVVKKVNFFGSEFLQMNSNWTNRVIKGFKFHAQPQTGAYFY